MSEFENFIEQAAALHEARIISAKASGDGVPQKETHKFPRGSVEFGPDGTKRVSK
ncbi:hypothetical protein HY385_02020 [Candidatus Daviesbacteria bacterium]|nr:hypothetical protein [Candidatus Daviesbacteria bacterium]